jgi:hypothetical protein
LPHSPFLSNSSWFDHPKLMVCKCINNSFFLSGGCRRELLQQGIVTLFIATQSKKESYPSDHPHRRRRRECPVMIFIPPKTHLYKKVIKYPLDVTLWAGSLICCPYYFSIFSRKYPKIRASEMWLFTFYST